MTTPAEAEALVRRVLDAVPARSHALGALLQLFRDRGERGRADRLRHAASAGPSCASTRASWTSTAGPTRTSSCS